MDYNKLEFVFVEIWSKIAFMGVCLSFRDLFE